MAELKCEKYIKKGVVPTETPHPEVTLPIIRMNSDDSFESMKFRQSFWPITEPFVMITEQHKHDTEQILVFLGGDMNNIMDLGGEVELTLSEDGVNKEKYVFTEATMVFVRKGLYHGPLNFKKINDPTKPILFHDFFFSSDYVRL